MRHGFGVRICGCAGAEHRTPGNEGPGMSGLNPIVYFIVAGVVVMLASALFRNMDNAQADNAHRRGDYKAEQHYRQQAQEDAKLGCNPIIIGVGMLIGGVLIALLFGGK